MQGLSLGLLKKKKDGPTSPRSKEEEQQQPISPREKDKPPSSARGSARGKSERKKSRGSTELLDVPQEKIIESRNSFDSSTERKPVVKPGDKTATSQPVDTRLAKVQKERKIQRKGSLILDSLSLEDITNSPIKRKRKKKKKSDNSSSTTAKAEPVYHYFVLRIEEAKGLRRGLIGHINPYCTFDIIPSGIIGARTSVVKWESNPRWREQFVGYFGLDGKPKPESFQITVMDKNSLSSDEFLGKAVIPFSKSIDQWFPLEGEKAQGELRVVLRFYTSEEGSRLYNIFKEEADVEALVQRWEKENTITQDLASEEQEEKEGETPVRVPPLDVPCFVSVNKIWTLFQLGVFKDRQDLVKRLHELECNINARDQTGNTAMHIAAVKRLQPQMRLLLRLGVDGKVQNYLGGKDYKEMMAMFKEDDDDIGSYML